MLINTVKGNSFVLFFLLVSCVSPAYPLLSFTYFLLIFAFGLLFIKIPFKMLFLSFLNTDSAPGWQVSVLRRRISVFSCNFFWKGGVLMFTPTPFGIMLKQVRENARLSQGELADELGKTAQYISNIEKGKNNSPPDDADLLKLIKKLALSDGDAVQFRLLAYADRGMLPPEMFQYVFNRPALIGLINYAMNNGVSEDYWSCVLQNIK